MTSRGKIKNKNIKFRYVLWLIGLVALIIVGHYGQVAFTRHGNLVQPDLVEKPTKLNVKANSALVVDCTTGQILGEKNADEQVKIASQSKMLTAYGVLQAVKKGQIKWDDQVTIPANADLSKQQKETFSHLEIRTGDRVSVRDLYTAMFTNSANDAAFALATYLTPANQTTQSVIQGWAKELKLSKSEWYNAAGQQNGDAFDNRIKTAPVSAANRASAKEVAQIASADLDLDPTLKTLGQQPYLTYTKNGRIKTTILTDFGQDNGQTAAQLKSPYNLSIVGLKTGSTPESGAALTAIVTDGQGHEFLTVINGAGDYEDHVQRFQKSLDMVGQVLDEKQARTYRKGESLQALPAPNTQAGKIAVHVANNQTFWVKKGKSLALKLLDHITESQIKKDELIGTAETKLRAEYLPSNTNRQQKILLASSQSSGPANNWQKILRFIWP